jgi:hypothetical protein
MSKRILFIKLGKGVLKFIKKQQQSKMVYYTRLKKIDHRNIKPVTNITLDLVFFFIFYFYGLTLDLANHPFTNKPNPR